MEKINTLLQKYSHFKYDRLQSIQKLPNSYILTIVVQDDEGEDLNSVEIEFTNINAEKILVDSVLGYLDMGSGITIIKEHDLYGFAVGSGTAMLHVHSAPLYIVSSDIKIEEK